MMTGSTSVERADPKALHAGSIVIDGTCPSNTKSPDSWWCNHYKEWIAGGATACVVTVAAWDSCRDTMGFLGSLHRFIRERDELVLASSVQDIRDAKRDGRLAVVLQFQGTAPIEYDEDLLELYWRLGLRVVQLTYNLRNPVGDGCEEPSDAGLSRFGRKVVVELNRLGMVVDVTHTGRRTSLDAIEASSAPCIASHSNAGAVHPNNRNLPDDLIRAIAGGGGVIGVNGFPSFVSARPSPTLDDYIDHMAYIADLVGPECVAIGLDYCDSECSMESYEELINEGHWTAESYTPPPWPYPTGLANASGLPNLTERLQQRGFSDQDIRGIIGENWMRVFERAWRGAPAADM